MIAPAQDSTTGGSITALLIELSQGNRGVGARLAPRIHDELRHAAARRMRRERANHTLQATAPVNEAWLRLMDQPNRNWESRAHFFALTSRLMRQILVDHARKRLADKRGGLQRQVNLSEPLPGFREIALVPEISANTTRRKCFPVRRVRARTRMNAPAGRRRDRLPHRSIREWSMARAWHDSR